MPEIAVTIPGTDYVEILLPKTEQEISVPLRWLNMTKIMDAFTREEAGDAELFAELFRGKAVFDHSERQWYLFGEHAWEKDRTGQVKKLVINQVAAQYLNAAAELRGLGLETSKDTIKDLHQRAASLRFSGRIDRVLGLAGIQDGIALTGEEWHKDVLLLACTNGVINLRDGFEFRQGKPEDYLRSVIPTEWKGIDEPAPRWEQFLLEIFAGKEEMSDFVRRLFGYGLTGLASEDRFPVLWGEGRNGKDTLLGVLEKVLGNEFAAPVKSEIIVSSDYNTSNATPQIMALRNRRLVWVSETNEGARINAGQVKLLTGGGTISARPLYGKPVEFAPTHMIMLMTNHKPHTGDDDAIWKRLLLIEFGQKFVDNPVAPNERKKDGFLEQKLVGEASGILAWLIRGAIEYFNIGISEPEIVTNATKEYRSKEDIIEEFLRDNCETGSGYSEDTKSLYEAYREWSDSSGYGRGMSKTAFGERLAKRFTRRHIRTGWVYDGLRVSI